MKSGATILDGNKIAGQIHAELAAEVRTLVAAGYRPGLAVILAGNDAGSEIYVRNKIKACEQLGIRSEKLMFAESVTTNDLLAQIAELNTRDDIDGILLQLPLPGKVDVARVRSAVACEKDVDCFHPANVGKLVAGRALLPPCTPAGVMEILRRSHITVAGRHAVVLGRSHVVGRPMALLLLNRDASVSICHSKTENVAALARQADILIAAAGKPAWVDETFVKPGATVIDVGINRITEKAEFRRVFGNDQAREKRFCDKGYVIVGDVHPRVAEIAGAITPVPGGVGPLTIAMLMANTVRACRMRHAEEAR